MEGWHIRLTRYSSIFNYFFINFEELGIMLHSSVPQIFWVICKWPKFNNNPTQSKMYTKGDQKPISKMYTLTEETYFFFLGPV